MDVDEALKLVDPKRRLQWIYAVAISAQALPGALIVLVMEFVGHTPKFECHQEGANGTQVLVDACFNGTTEHCDRIVFRHPYTSVVTEWSLVCERASEAHALQSLFMAGMTMASLPIGPLADRFGRRRLVLLTFGLQALLMGALALSPNYGTFAALRFLTGSLQAGGFPNFTLTTELVGPQLRSKVGLFGSVFFSAGILCLSLAAYLITSWRWLLVFSAVVAALSVLVIGVVAPQSARWLLQKGRTRQAEEVLLGMARSNGLTPPSDFSLVASKQEGGSTSDHCCSLFTRGRAALWTVVLCFNWAVHTLSYYGLTAAAAGMGSGRFSSFAFSGLVELPPVLVVTWVLERLGRRYTLSGTMAIGGVACLLIYVLPAVYIDDHGGRLTLSLIGKLCISTTFTVTYIFSGEIFPTSLRNTGLGIVNICARLAGVMYPFVALLNTVSKDSHFLLFGVLITSSALFDLLLPETLGKTLPKDVDEMLGNDIEMYAPLKLEESDSDVELDTTDEKDVEIR
ncbi:solute carrier family 22 member 15-like [Amphibalanus amphitrite]|uniref:solute carrier family 22 member 15-like n=1 Tax=Amphibalanus amphitrite TaxID=1232801 RepID=UPI001C90D649|nr:solute carrier family 22 member 15-like [Amphibalanus amphitrite]